MIRIKRIYEEPEEEDGFRILIDRLWARGMSKERAKVDIWLKDVAPSDELRKWFSHDADKWSEFKKKYLKELKDKQELLEKIREIEKKEKIVTLLYSAKNEKYNQAIVLKEIL